MPPASDPASMRVRELYRSDNLLVREVRGRRAPHVVVTFDNHSIGPGFDRPAFAEEFLKREGIAAIHIMGKGDDWYQYPDTLKACRIARAFIPPRARVMTYGSSMGGYAALRFADALRADAVLALSPQYSIDRAVLPWEFRWGQDSDRIAFRSELAGPFRVPGEAVVLFDPNGLDGRHAELLAQEIKGCFVPLPYTGHPVTEVLGEVRLLGPIALELAQGTLDTSGLRARIRARRRASAIYLGALALAQPRSRPRTALGLAELAAAASSAKREGPHALATILGRVGRHAEALAIHEERLAKGGRDVLDLIPFAEALLAAGEPARAVEVGREVVAREHRRGHLHHWFAWILDHAGRLNEAIAEERIAVAMIPGSSLFRDTLADLEGRTVIDQMQVTLYRRLRRGALALRDKLNR